MNWKFNAIILARSGSKRLPGKNFAVELTPGRTLLEIAIEKAKKLTDRVLVSADVTKITEIAERNGASGIVSPYHTDWSSSIDAVLYAINERGITGHVLLMQLTSPLILVEDVERAILEYTGSPIFAARRASELWWSWGKDAPIFPQWQEVRSQDLPPAFLPCGAFYIASVEHLKTYKSFMRPNARPFEIPRERAIDIDTQSDLEAARWHLQRSQGQPHKQSAQ